MEPQAIVERLIAESPKLHWATEEEAQYLTKYYEQKFEAGPISHSVPHEVHRYLAKRVTSEHCTLETGSGQTTVVLAALAKHHTCISPDKESVELVKNYMGTVGIPSTKVTFFVQSSDLVLPTLSLTEDLDFAFIDGCHGYPYPALDWHYIDFFLKVGGIVGLDNIEIDAVQNHCRFLEENDSYQLLDTITSPAQSLEYGAKFYLKQKDQTAGQSLPRSRQWISQRHKDLFLNT